MYQWLARTPDRAGAFVILRFRARAERGEARLAVGPHLPLLIPREDRGSVAERLRAVSTPHPMMAPRNGMEASEYRPLDWVQPEARCRTYVIVWDWPEFAIDPGFRDIVLNFAGIGEVWIDDIEMFA